MSMACNPARRRSRCVVARFSASRAWSARAARNCCAAIFALDPVRSGRVRVAGYSGGASPESRWTQGVGMVSEDRKGEGVALGLDVTDNLTLTRLTGMGPASLVLPARQRSAAARWVERLAIKCAAPTQPVVELSGGNQQKVAFARLLHHDVDVLLLDEPTRGIDVGSKAQIYAIIDALVASAQPGGRRAQGHSPGEQLSSRAPRSVRSHRRDATRAGLARHGRSRSGTNIGSCSRRPAPRLPRDASPPHRRGRSGSRSAVCRRHVRRADWRAFLSSGKPRADRASDRDRLGRRARHDRRDRVGRHRSLGRLGRGVDHRRHRARCSARGGRRWPPLWREWLPARPVGS